MIKKPYSRDRKYFQKWIDNQIDDVRSWLVMAGIDKAEFFQRLADEEKEKNGDMPECFWYPPVECLHLFGPRIWQGGKESR